MNSAERRKNIVAELKRADDPISAAALAAESGVTRQVIVSDIALLRAEGYNILSERRGYYMEKPRGGILDTVICRHDASGVLDEFYAVVDNGGTVINVIVEHPIYGQISAELNITSRYDAEDFVAKAKESNASQLSELTDGVHIHTISVPDRAAFTRIVDRLALLGILYEDPQEK